VKEIQLTKGHVARVDDADFEELSKFRWVALAVRNVVYAVRRFKRDDGKWGTEYMHRRVTDAPSGVLVDHIDGDGLNNTRSNLRLATNAQNQANSRSRTNGPSGFRGVHWNKQVGKWHSNITVAGRTTTVGWFTCPVEAAKARDASALELHGEFAVLNFDSEREVA
jgi:hypothetical protein